MDHDHGGQYFAICSLCGYPHNPQNKCPVTLTDKIRKDQEGAGSIVIDLNDLAKENAAFAARIRELEGIIGIERIETKRSISDLDELLHDLRKERNVLIVECAAMNSANGYLQSRLALYSRLEKAVENYSFCGPIELWREIVAALDAAKEGK